MLAAWLEVGTALAELRHKVAYVYETIRSRTTIGPLNRAVDRLPSEDHKLAQSFIFGIPYRTLAALAIKIREAYHDLCQCLSTRDLPERQARADDSNRTR